MFSWLFWKRDFKPQRDNICTRGWSVMMASYLLLHVRHLRRRFVPQLVRHAQVHLHSFVDQILQRRHRLTGSLRLDAPSNTGREGKRLGGKRSPPGSMRSRFSGQMCFKSSYLGVPEAAWSLSMNIILQDALTDVVQHLCQPGFSEFKHTWLNILKNSQKL